MVGSAHCWRYIQVRPVAAGRSITPYSSWQIHRHKVKMKRFESNLHGNRLLLCPEVDQCLAKVAGLEERHFPSSSARDGATCISSIIQTGQGQRGPWAPASASMILLLMYFTLVSLLTPSVAQQSWIESG